MHDSDGRSPYDGRRVSHLRRLAVLASTVVLLAGCGGAAAVRRQPASPPRAAPASALDPAIAPATTLQGPAGPRDAPVPILMYHVIATASARAPYAGLWVPAARFSSQMAAMARSGYHAVTLGRVYSAWHGRSALPVRPFVVSFDDGYESQYRTARVVLDHLGWPGVLNLEVHNVDLPGGLSRNQVADLVRDGWEIDAHSLTHPDMTTLDPRTLRHEVAGSRRWLQRVFGVPARFFAYPAGRYDARVEAAVRRAGFHGATTTEGGVGSPRDDPYQLPRLRITADMSPAELVALVRAPAQG
jgi:peptidoglycan/xylan/chitin deacetylase (PgdA/CDA1 family)